MFVCRKYSHALGPHILLSYFYLKIKCSPFTYNKSRYSCLSHTHTHTHTHTLRVYVIYKLQEKMVICSLPSHLRGRKKNAYLFGLLHILCRSHFFSSMPLRVLLRRGCKPVRMITKSAYYFRHVRPSICPHTSARLPLDGFP